MRARCPQRRVLLWRHRERGEIQCPPAWLLLSCIPFYCKKSHFNLLELDVDPEKERAASCMRASELAAARRSHRPQSSRVRLKAQVPVFLRIVGIPVDGNAGWGGKLEQCDPCICRNDQLSWGSPEQLAKMKNRVLLQISQPGDHSGARPLGSLCFLSFKHVFRSASWTLA